MFNEMTKVNLLYDFYGELLTDKQKEVMKLYHEENLSLSEIADEFSISRQGVHDALKNAEKSLNDYEGKLKLVEKFEAMEIMIEKINLSIEEILECEALTEDMEEIILKIKTGVNSLND